MFRYHPEYEVERRQYEADRIAIIVAQRYKPKGEKPMIYCCTGEREKLRQKLGEPQLFGDLYLYYY